MRRARQRITSLIALALQRSNPSDFLKTVIGRPVVVKLNSGVDYRGAPLDARLQNCSTRAAPRAPSAPAPSSTSLGGHAHAGVLACLDGYMNIAMEQTEEYQNGQLKAKYGDTFIRGNNVLYISTQKKKS